jgi:hypothetical protein
MPAARRADDRRLERLLLVVLGFVFLVVFLILEKIAVFAGFTFFFLFFLVVVEVIGDEVQMYGMRLGDLELGLTLGAAQDLAFFNFVFVHIDLCGALGAADHGTSSVTISQAGFRRTVLPPSWRIIYPVV